ncbi:MULTISPECIES: sensor histidine kinase [unclassified Leucobacter]|uniref:sensor histidine kinase n=1 Tax=unclassified Leucobacter TaxID=2621730 RepID=UPI00165DB575|nr:MULTISPECIES: histidine kinase [unclassified Leucobacter]MBC9937441.1 histidine kinase [Leucobacter sp. cx-87]
MTGPHHSTRPGDGVHATWTYTLGSIVFFFAMIDALMLVSLAESATRSGAPLEYLLLFAIVAASVVQIRYCWFLRVGAGGGFLSTGWTVALVAPAALSWTLAWVLPAHTLFAALPVWLSCSLVVCLLPRSRRLPLLAGAGVLAALPVAVHALLGVEPLNLWGSGPDLLVVVYALMLPLMLLLSLWFWRVVLRLDESRLVAGELAVTQERLRFAADLHDIQGHHLQVIALKAELAERLLERDPAAAADQLHEVRMIAKTAMEETRSLVAGLREVTLDAELENAREVLALAGADCALDLGPLPADRRVRRALALCVREATTNILRHSDARSASIVLRATAEGCTLQVTNDGLAPVQDPAARAPGSGLAGLRERVVELGGSLEASVDPSSDRHELLVWVPVRAGVPA